MMSLGHYIFEREMRHLALKRLDVVTTHQLTTGQLTTGQLTRGQLTTGQLTTGMMGTLVITSRHTGLVLSGAFWSFLEHLHSQLSSSHLLPFLGLPGQLSLVFLRDG